MICFSVHDYQNIDMNDASDFLFLVALGKKREWKKGCVICLIENIMGTTCKCGHTEVCVFRPCGHALCVDPCFKDFVESNNLKLDKKKLLTFGNKVFEMNQIGVDLNLESKNILCPICRTKINKTFRAEDTKFEVFEYTIDILTNIINKDI